MREYLNSALKFLKTDVGRSYVRAFKTFLFAFVGMVCVAILEGYDLKGLNYQEIVAGSMLAGLGYGGEKLRRVQQAKKQGS